MNEIIKRVFEDREIIIGDYTTRAATSYEQRNKVMRMLRLYHVLTGIQESDIFFFEFNLNKNDWMLNPNLCFLNLESPRLDMFQKKNHYSNLTFDDFIEYVFEKYYKKNG